MWCLDLKKLAQYKKTIGNPIGAFNPGYNSGVDTAFGWEQVRTKQPQNHVKGNQMAVKKTGPGAVGHHTSIVFGNDMFLFGGSNSRSENKGFFKLNCLNQQWELVGKTKAESAFASRDGHSASLSPELGNMYIFGGFIAGVNSNSLVVFNF